MPMTRKPALRRWTWRYERLLRERGAMTGEAALEAAYALGRDAMARRVGVLELVEAHGLAIAKMRAGAGVNGSGHEDPLLRGTQVLLESLVPFEIAHRGYHEVHAALGASRARYGELVDNANDVIFSATLEGRLTALNRAGERLLGYSKDEVKLLKLDSLFASTKVRRLFAKYRADKGAKRRRRCEIDVIARDGRIIPIDLSTRLIFEDGAPVGVQGIARDITHRKQAESALRHLNQRLEEKAKRIAHALHDEAGQLLASVYLKIAEIAKASSSPTERASLLELRGLLDQVSEQVRRLAHELRPSVLDDLGLIPACEFLADGVSKRFGVTVHVYGSTGGRLPPALEIALYRMSQEALTNAVRHGRANRMGLEFKRRASAITGKIWDDGAGFDVGATLHHEKEKGLGLVGMRQRLVELGGKLSINSRPGHGTTIEFEAPLGASDVGISAARG